MLSAGGGLAGGIMHQFSFSTPVDVSDFSHFFAVVDYGPNSGLDYPLGVAGGRSDHTWVSLTTGDQFADLELLHAYALNHTVAYHVFATSAIPEPGTYALLVGAIIGGVVILRRRRP